MSHQAVLVGLFPQGGGWCLARDGDPVARAIFRRHYSYKPYRDGRQPHLFCGPGEKLVLLTARGDALFIWRRFRSKDGQDGVNCAVFRNEGERRSSELIGAAMGLAWARWPRERLYTYVNPRAVRSNNPGYCFLRAGWNRCGTTQCNRLLILEAWPPKEE